MDMCTAFKLFFTRTFDFDGRSSRKEFWLGILPNAVIMLILIGLTVYALSGFSEVINPFSITMLTLFSLFCIIEIVPSLSLIVRRMHDIGKSGKYLFVLFIPIVGFVWYIYLVTRKTDHYRTNEN